MYVCECVVRSAHYKYVFFLYVCMYVYKYILNYLLLGLSNIFWSRAQLQLLLHFDNFTRLLFLYFFLFVCIFVFFFIRFYFFNYKTL